jgi:adenylate cyclase
VTALVSEAVVRDAGRGFAFRQIDRVAVKGKSIGVTVYELLGPAGEAASPAVTAYEAALEDYFARGFDSAIERLVPHAPADAPSRVLLERCRALRDDPPPADWDGVYVATSK